MQTCVPNSSCMRPPEAAHRSSEETELKTRTPRDSVTALGLLSKLRTSAVVPFKPYSLYLCKKQKSDTRWKCKARGFAFAPSCGDMQQTAKTLTLQPPYRSWKGQEAHASQKAQPPAMAKSSLHQHKGCDPSN